MCDENQWEIGCQSEYCILLHKWCLVGSLAKVPIVFVTAASVRNPYVGMHCTNLYTVWSIQCSRAMSANSDLSIRRKNLCGWKSARFAKGSCSVHWTVKSRKLDLTGYGTYRTITLGKFAKFGKFTILWQNLEIRKQEISWGAETNFSFFWQFSEGLTLSVAWISGQWKIVCCLHGCKHMAWLLYCTKSKTPLLATISLGCEFTKNPGHCWIYRFDQLNIYLLSPMQGSRSSIDRSHSHHSLALTL